MVPGIELRSEERKVARGWQIMRVVGYVWWCNTYVRSSEGSAGYRANGVSDILLSKGYRRVMLGRARWLGRVDRYFWLLNDSMRNA
jgi:hypothetical protein